MFGHRFSVLIFACALAGSIKAAQPAANFFDDRQLHDVHITVDANDWATLRQTYTENTYYHADVSSGGESATSVGIRSRGRGSRSPDKPNLDVNVDKYVKHQTFASLAFFTLKANNQDASMLREPISFELFRRMGLPAPREAQARLFINDEYFGLYTIVEHIDEDFLTRAFGENTGDLYEWKPNEEYHFEYLGDDPALYSPILLDPSNDNPDVSVFVDFVKAVNQSSDADFISAITPYIDPKLYLTHAAVENVMAEIDGLLGSTYGVNNIYLYRFDGQKRFQIIAWDKDLTTIYPNQDIMAGVADDVLARRLMAIPEYRNAYLTALLKASAILGGSGGWADQEVTRLYNLIHDSAINDPHKQCIQDDGSIAACGPQDFETGVQNLHQFLAARQSSVTSQVLAVAGGGGPVQPAAKPVAASAVTLSPAASHNLVPGEIIRISGTNLGTATVSGDPLPRIGDDAFVAVNGVRAPILALSNGEAEIQLPWDLQTGTAWIVSIVKGVQSDTLDVNVVGSNPEVLAVVHANGSVISAAQPAAPGEAVTAYAIGLGSVSGTPLLGTDADLNSLISTAAPPGVRVNSSPATVTFAGLAPGLIGLYQVNFTMPGNERATDNSAFALSSDAQ